MSHTPTPWVLNGDRIERVQDVRPYSNRDLIATINQGPEYEDNGNLLIAAEKGAAWLEQEEKTP